MCLGALFRQLWLKPWLILRYRLGNATPVQASENLVRFLFSKGTEFTAKPDGSLRIKAAGLIPYSYVELSIFRDRELNTETLWLLGDVFVAAKRKRPILAKSTLPAASFHRHSLTTRPDELPPRHGVVNGWPTEKHAQIAIAHQLIADANPSTLPKL